MKIYAGWIAIVCLLLINPGFAQIVNRKLYEVTGQSSAPEVSMAVHPRSPLIIVAATGPDNVFHSEDGGKSWKNVKVKSSFGFYGSPVVACDSRGTFYLIHPSDVSGKGIRSETSFSTLVCQMSGDGGKTWDDGLPFGGSPDKDQANPFAQVDSKGNVWVVWTQFDKYSSSDSACHSVIMTSSSSNGKKWSAPRVLSQVHGKCANDLNTVAGGTLALSEEKKMFACWANQELIFVDRSFDSGDLWLTNDIIVTSQKGGWAQPMSGHQLSNGLPMLVIDRSKTEQRGMLYLAWSDQRSGNGDSDIWFSRSNNYGDIWTPAMKVNGGTDKQPQYLPVMTVDNGTGSIYILYYDRRNYEDDQTDVYLAYSHDAGSTFKNIKVSENPFTPAGEAFGGRNLYVSASKGNIVAIWSRVDGKTISLMSAQLQEGILPK
jgi:hypothetical protein